MSIVKLHVTRTARSVQTPHMLTKEAVQLFLDKLKPDGMVLLHTSNRYLDLDAVLGSTLRRLPEGTAGLVMHDLRSAVPHVGRCRIRQQLQRD